VKANEKPATYRPTRSGNHGELSVAGLMDPSVNFLIGEYIAEQIRNFSAACFNFFGNQKNIGQII
jgi:hypothetical protein